MKKLHVAVGVIFKDNAVLVSLRKSTAHMGGYWEFPGGKVEVGESPADALCREINEELGISCTEFSPLHCYTHQYPDREVKLDVWRIDAFDGSPEGVEGQAIEWVAPDKLIELNMIPANFPIINAIRLPKRYGISQHFDGPPAKIVDNCVKIIESAQLRLFQLRVKNLEFKHLVDLSQALLPASRDLGCALVVNSELRLFDFVDVEGVHLSQHNFDKLKTDLQARPKGKLLGLSCHSEEEICRANAVDLDYISISPILQTASHLEAVPLGWENCYRLCQLSRSPVYALGGMKQEHLAIARANGAHGIAAIRGFQD